jgi:hypothetical protein
VVTTGHLKTLVIIGLSMKFLGAGDENRTRVLSLGSRGACQTTPRKLTDHEHIRDRVWEPIVALGASRALSLRGLYGYGLLFEPNVNGRRESTSGRMVTLIQHRQLRR